MKVKIFNEFSDELKIYWESLEKNDTYIFQHYYWNEYWYEKIGKYQNLNIYIILILDTRDNPIMLVPLCQKKYKFFKILTFLGGKQNDYNNILVCNKYYLKNNSIDELWNYVFQNLPKHDILYLNKIPNNNQYFTSNQFFNTFNIQEFNKSYFTLLPNNIDFLMQSKKKKKIKSDLIRQIKRLSELGNLTFEVVVDPILYKSYMKILIEQKRERFKSTSVPDALSKQNIREFYYNINDNKSLKKNSHLSVLKLNDEIIACHWGLVNEKNFYYLMPSFNIKFANYSPGKILIYNLLIWSIENDFKIFDFTIGSEDYKKEWSDNEMILHQYIQHKSLLGFYAKIYFKLIDYVKNNKPLWNFLRKIYRNIN